MSLRSLLKKIIKRTYFKPDINSNRISLRLLFKKIQDERILRDRHKQQSYIAPFVVQKMIQEERILCDGHKSNRILLRLQFKKLQEERILCDGHKSDRILFRLLVKTFQDECILSDRLKQRSYVASFVTQKNHQTNVF